MNEKLINGMMAAGAIAECFGLHTCYIGPHEETLRDFYRADFHPVMRALKKIEEHATMKMSRSFLRHLTLDLLTPSASWLKHNTGLIIDPEVPPTISARYRSNRLCIEIWRGGSECRLTTLCGANGSQDRHQPQIPIIKGSPVYHPIAVADGVIGRIYLYKFLQAEVESEVSAATHRIWTNRPRGKEGSMELHDGSGPGLYEVTIWDDKTNKIYVDTKIAAKGGAIALVKSCMGADLPEDFDIDSEHIRVTVNKRG